MGQARMSLESLAVLPVINSLVFIFRSVGLSYQEVVIALIGEKFENRKQLKEFAVWLGAAAFILLGLIAYTPLNEIWFHSISGLSMELTNFSHLPLMILAVIPVLSVVISYQRSVLVASKKTSPITWGTSLEVIGIIGTLVILIIGYDVVGVTAAAAAFVIGRLMANIYLMKYVILARYSTR
jgi:O-antigen/teichoic acid export membrane protein